MLSFDIVQRYVRRLSTDRVPEIAWPILLDHPSDRRIAHDPYTIRVCDQDRSFEHAAFVNPVGSGHVTVAVPREESSKDALRAFLTARQDRRYPGPYRPFPDNKFAFAGDQCLVSDLHSFHIGDCIKRPRRSVEGNS